MRQLPLCWAGGTVMRKHKRNATFAGGEEAEWWLDQMGQLSMNPKSEGFRPNQEQMMSFQKELQKAVQDKGF